MPVISQNLSLFLANKIRNYHQEVGLSGAQLDVSGGIDSAVMLGLLVKALGLENVTAVYSNINSSYKSGQLACKVALTFNVKLLRIDLTGVYKEIAALVKNAYSTWKSEAIPGIQEAIRKDPTINGSLRSCLRAPVGRYINRCSGGIRHGTGNEDEDRWLRFYQKGGDGEVDTNPLASLSKGEVYQLACQLGVPEEIIEALPTPDLQGVGDTHNDESELKALSGCNWSYSRVNPWTGHYISIGTIEAFSRLLDINIQHLISGTWEDMVFGDRSPIHNEYVEMWRTWGKFYHEEFRDQENFIKFAKSARKFERTTRHKWNPNCPSLTTRKELLEEKLLTNDLYITTP